MLLPVEFLWQVVGLPDLVFLDMLVNSFPPYQYLRPCCYLTTTLTPVLVFVLDATSVASTKSIKARKKCIVFNICQFIIFLVVLVVLINLSQEGHHLDVQDLIPSSPVSILDSWFLLDGDWSDFLEQGPICVNTFKFQTTKPISEVYRSMCICHTVIHDLEVTASFRLAIWFSNANKKL